MADRRVTPARPDLAATYLKGKVDAPRFVEGEKFAIGVGRASLRVLPSDEAAQDSELLFGEGFTVYDRTGGWAWVRRRMIFMSVMCAKARWQNRSWRKPKSAP